MKDFGKKKEEDNSAFEEYHDPQGAYIKSNIEGIIGDNEGGKEEIKQSSGNQGYGAPTNIFNKNETFASQTFNQPMGSSNPLGSQQQQQDKPQDLGLSQSQQKKSSDVKMEYQWKMEDLLPLPKMYHQENHQVGKIKIKTFSVLFQYKIKEQVESIMEYAIKKVSKMNLRQVTHLSQQQGQKINKDIEYKTVAQVLPSQLISEQPNVEYETYLRGDLIIIRIIGRSADVDMCLVQFKFSFREKFETEDTLAQIVMIETRRPKFKGQKKGT